MATRIGPTFSIELDAAGITDRRFSWGLDGDIQFHPDYPKSERDKVLAVLAAHQGELSTARAEALEAVRAETARRIGALYGQLPGSLDLIVDQLNALDEAFAVLQKGASALPEERVALTAYRDKRARLRAIREAGRDAKAGILGAKSADEARGVEPVWPA